MLKSVIAAVTTSCMTIGVVAQPLSENEKRIINELSGELLECSVYFSISAECLRRQQFAALHMSLRGTKRTFRHVC